MIHDEDDDDDDDDDDADTNIYVYILLNIYTNNLYADDDARSMTTGKNTRSYTLRSVP